ncbi:SAM-dependent methyltransferase [Streptomyces albiflavescens]|uniref:SAM-dependent methyltransferase n=1 Tax=Streptomyces albiflavescens TaxID=1623582 RepID=A0A918D7G8_9ACTN|nr:class I SAM-dependent methyltransferase [Streptomyces albiflavescens]GGN79553.1 SAM-dependent methyltransferase [Streptomyces albiflavescens]
MSVSPHRSDATAPRGPDDLYATPPPWDIGRPQPAFLALAEEGAIRGRVLDAGCGTGEHVLMAAALGLDATGIDLAARALRTAEEKARARDLTVRFVRHDARQPADLGEHFDTVLDCGLFHVFDGEDRTAYVGGLRSVLPQGGRYFMLCVSDRERGAWGTVHKVTRGDIQTAFSDGWHIDSVEPSAIELSVAPGHVEAWLVTLTRT